MKSVKPNQTREITNKLETRIRRTKATNFLRISYTKRIKRKIKNKKNTKKINMKMKTK